MQRSTTAIDEQVGRPMWTLKDLDLEKDALVLFTSDHGDMLGSQGARLKRKPWEELIRVPGVREGGPGDGRPRCCRCSA